MQTLLLNNQSAVSDYLSTRICSIDSWLDAHTHYFNPLETDSKQALEFKRKAFGEAGLYIYQQQENKVGTGVKNLTEHFWNVLSTEDFMQLAKRNLNHFGLFTAPIAVAKSMGKSAEFHDEYFHQIYRSQYLSSIELPPFRLLDNLFFGKVFGLKEFPYSIEEVNKLLNIHRLPDLIHADETQAYALTHNIFYLTGMKKQNDFMEIGTQYNNSHLEALEGLFVRYMALNNLDLGLELLLCLVLTGQCKQWHLTYALKLVDKLLINNEIVPGPGEPKGFDLIEDKPEEFKTWVKHYHTMLVAGMTFKLAAQHLDDIWKEGEPLEEFAPYGCGQVLRLLSDYNLPLALTVLKTLELHTDSIKNMGLTHALDRSLKFINQQLQSDGSIGFYDEEYSILKSNGQSEDDAYKNIQQPIKTIYNKIEWSAFNNL